MQSSIYRLKQKIQGRDALPPSGGLDRQAALNKSLSHRTPCPEVPLAPEHGRTDDLLGLVVHKFDLIHLDEGPRVLPQPALFECERLDPGNTAFLGSVQYRGALNLDHAPVQPQAFAGECGLPVLVMQFKESLSLGNSPCSLDLRPEVLSLRNCAPIPLEMRKANSSPLEGAVDGPADNDHAGIIARENFSPRFVPMSLVQLEDNSRSAASPSELSLLPLVRNLMKN